MNSSQGPLHFPFCQFFLLVPLFLIQARTFFLSPFPNLDLPTWPWASKWRPGPEAARRFLQEVVRQGVQDGEFLFCSQTC